jgi:hypothetical protein
MDFGKVKLAAEYAGVGAIDAERMIHRQECFTEKNPLPNPSTRNCPAQCKSLWHVGCVGSLIRFECAFRHGEDSWLQLCDPNSG